MITEELQKKIDFAISLLRSAAPKDGSPVEVAYSGGKDSDVILQLVKESGINYRAIYKNTTIDPPGTVKHVREMGVEVVMPKNGVTFFSIVAAAGMPNRFKRLCCQKLKEYKILDTAVIGVRKAESQRRKARYKEPIECRTFRNKSVKAQHIYPILEWTDKDVLAFILDRNLQLAKVYYDESGNIDVSRRLGCLCCPMQSNRTRLQAFRTYPNMVKAYVRAAGKFLKDHPNTKTAQKHKDGYEYFCRELFYDSQKDFENSKESMFNDSIDYKAFLEDYFKIKFNESTI